MNLLVIESAVLELMKQKTKVAIGIGLVVFIKLKNLLLKGTIMKITQKLFFVQILCTLLLFTITCSLYSQASGYKYSYDDAGNRVEREYNQFLFKQGDTTITQENYDDYKISVYPNPFEHHLKVEITGLSKKNQLSFQLVDLQGNILLERVNANSFFQLDMKEHNSGTYFLHFQIDEKRIIWKLIKSY